MDPGLQRLCAGHLRSGPVSTMCARRTDHPLGEIMLRASHLLKKSLACCCVRCPSRPARLPPTLLYERTQVTSAASIETVADALAVLRSEYSGLLADLSSGDRVLWVGSGVSRNQVPGLEQLIRKVLGFLRDNIAPGVPSDPHLGALERIITAQLPSELDGFRSDPCSWAVPDDLTPLVRSYSDILGEDVDGKPQDYLVWDAVGGTET